MIFKGQFMVAYSIAEFVVRESSMKERVRYSKGVHPTSARGG